MFSLWALLVKDDGAQLCAGSMVAVACVDFHVLYLIDKFLL